MDEALRRAYESLSLQELREEYGPGVVGFGVGKRYVDGRVTDEDCIVIYVEKKLPFSDLAALGVPALPQEIDGIPVDVEEGGEIKPGLSGPRLTHETDDLRRMAEVGGTALSVLRRIRRSDRPQLDLDELLELLEQLCPDDPEPPLTGRWRPLAPAISVGHPNVTAGTLGCIVGYEGGPAMLSNNHVIADQNRADLGDPVWQPGRHDGGNRGDAVARLAAFGEIGFGAQPNEGWEDSAVAVLDEGVDFDLTYPRSGDLLSGVVPESDIVVTGEEHDRRKVGRTTGDSKGTLRTFPTTARVNYGGGKVAEFPWQCSYTDISDPGDSGSAIRMVADGRMEALLYAGSDFVTIGHVAERVWDHYGLEVL